MCSVVRPKKTSRKIRRYNTTQTIERERNKRFFLLRCHQHTCLNFSFHYCCFLEKMHCIVLHIASWFVSVCIFFLTHLFFPSSNRNCSIFAYRTSSWLCWVCSFTILQVSFIVESRTCLMMAVRNVSNFPLNRISTHLLAPIALLLLSLIASLARFLVIVRLCCAGIRRWYGRWWIRCSTGTLWMENFSQRKERQRERNFSLKFVFKVVDDDERCFARFKYMYF